MANASLGILAVSLSLWAADLGAARLQNRAADVNDEPAAATTMAEKKCESGVTAATDSDLEVVVCAKPLAGERR